MNRQQEAVLKILKRGDKERDLYEGRDGQYWVTYSAEDKYEPLTRGEAEDLAAAIPLVQRWPGCYMLPTPNAVLSGAATDNNERHADEPRPPRTRG